VVCLCRRTAIQLYSIPRVGRSGVILNIGCRPGGTKQVRRRGFLAPRGRAEGRKPWLPRPSSLSRSYVLPSLSIGELMPTRGLQSAHRACVVGTACCTQPTGAARGLSATRMVRHPGRRRQYRPASATAAPAIILRRGRHGPLPCPARSRPSTRWQSWALRNIYSAKYNQTRCPCWRASGGLEGVRAAPYAKVARPWIGDRWGGARARDAERTGKRGALHYSGG
jgi:hypothetical protein